MTLREQKNEDDEKVTRVDGQTVTPPERATAPTNEHRHATPGDLVQRALEETRRERDEAEAQLDRAYEGHRRGCGKRAVDIDGRLVLMRQNRCTCGAGCPHGDALCPCQDGDPCNHEPLPLAVESQLAALRASITALEKRLVDMRRASALCDEMIGPRLCHADDCAGHDRAAIST